ncbi:MAG: ABC transporter ATP-binding protein [Anaerolineae bacterium]|nr:ABC transporter ATP-binding protein [Anaerolineae bacterium]
MTTQPVIYTENLTKMYAGGAKAITALDALTLEVLPGEIFGYLGPNGAGKTTTIKLLLDLIRPSAGRASLFGLDARAQSVAIHARVGFIPGELNLWKNRTGRQVIQYIASVRGGVAAQLAEASRLAQRLQLDTSRLVRDYSTGNRRKLGLVLAMMHRPELLILDEPTGGLDPLMQQEFNAMMLEFRQSGRTVFLSSHILGEVQAICQRVGILRAGQLKAVESVEKLMQVGYRQVELTFREAVPPEWQERLERAGAVADVRLHGDRVSLKLAGDFDPVLRAVAGGYVRDIRVEEPGLEDIFLSFYGNGHSAVPPRVPEVQR